MVIIELGDYWKNQFKTKLRPLMYKMRLHRYLSTPSHCPGGWNEERNEFDYEADVLYHTEHPTARQCVNGLIGSIEKHDIKGFYFSNLNQSMIKMIPIDNLDVNEGILVVDGYMNLNNVVVLEYPDGEYHSVIYHRDLKLGEYVIAKYAKLKRAEYLNG